MNERLEVSGTKDWRCMRDCSREQRGIKYLGEKGLVVENYRY
jgi:hypothetical protein